MPDLSTDEIDAGIEVLRHLDLDALRLRWRATFRRSAPMQLPKHLLLRLLTYRLQAQAFGDLDIATVKFLDRLSRQKESDGACQLGSPTIALPGQGALRPGTLLSRDHDGVRHHVTVVETGFAWNGNVYSSLSKVAKTITGTNWNGPRFFGLRDRERSGT